MTIFALTYNLHKPKDQTILQDLLESWEGLQVMETTWLLKRNDGCTCQDVIDDLLNHIDAENEIFVVEIAQKNGESLMEHHIP